MLLFTLRWLSQARDSEKLAPILFALHAIFSQTFAYCHPSLLGRPHVHFHAKVAAQMVTLSIIPLFGLLRLDQLSLIVCSRISMKR